MRKHTLKKAISALVLAVVMFTVSTTSFAASAIETDDLKSPRYAQLISFYVDLSLEKTTFGTYASYSAIAESLRGYSIEIVAELQKKDGGWQVVTSQTDGGDQNVCCNSGCYVSSGHTYRVRGTAKVYDSRGNLVETAVKYSSEVS